MKKLLLCVMMMPSYVVSMESDVEFIARMAARMANEVENKEDERIRAAFDAASQRDEGDPTNDHHALPDNYSEMDVNNCLVS